LQLPLEKVLTEVLGGEKDAFLEAVVELTLLLAPSPRKRSAPGGAVGGGAAAAGGGRDRSDTLGSDATIGSDGTVGEDSDGTATETEETDEEPTKARGTGCPCFVSMVLLHWRRAECRNARTDMRLDCHGMYAQSYHTTLWTAGLHPTLSLSLSLSSDPFAPLSPMLSFTAPHLAIGISPRYLPGPVGGGAPARAPPPEPTFPKLDKMDALIPLRTRSESGQVSSTTWKAYLTASRRRPFELVMTHPRAMLLAAAPEGIPEPADPRLLPFFAKIANITSMASSLEPEWANVVAQLKIIAGSLEEELQRFTVVTPGRGEKEACESSYVLSGPGLGLYRLAAFGPILTPGTPITYSVEMEAGGAPQSFTLTARKIDAGGVLVAVGTAASALKSHMFGRAFTKASLLFVGVGTADREPWALDVEPVLEGTPLVEFVLSQYPADAGATPDFSKINIESLSQNVVVELLSTPGSAATNTGVLTADGELVTRGENASFARPYVKQASGQCCCIYSFADGQRYLLRSMVLRKQHILCPPPPHLCGLSRPCRHQLLTVPSSPPHPPSGTTSHQTGRHSVKFRSLLLCCPELVAHSVHKTILAQLMGNPVIELLKWLSQLSVADAYARRLKRLGALGRKSGGSGLGFPPGAVKAMCQTWLQMRELLLEQEAREVTINELFAKSLQGAALFYEHVVAGSGKGPAALTRMDASDSETLEDTKAGDVGSPPEEHTDVKADGAERGTLNDAVWELLAMVDPEACAPEELAKIVQVVGTFDRFPNQDRLPPSWQGR
jgi:hypothetical protein